MSAATPEEIRARLIATLAPMKLDVINEGHLHVGHAHEDSGHYRMRIVSTAFEDMTPLQRHRLVYEALGDLIGQGIHALAIEARTPTEDAC